MSNPESIFLIGEAMGENEQRIGKGFVGTSGALLIQMLADAHVIALTAEDRVFLKKFYSTQDPYALDAIWERHPDVYRTNVFQIHPPGNDLKHLCGPKAEGIPGFPALVPSKYVSARYSAELDRLGDEILLRNPNLLVALGNSALWALAGRTGISKLRGTTGVSTHCVSGYKFLCTYHPAAVARQWELRPTTVADLRKITKEKGYPDVRRPNVQIYIEPTLAEISTFIDTFVKGCEVLSVDIETSGNQVTIIGLAPRCDLALVVPFHDDRAETRSYWESARAERECWELIRSVLEDKRIRKVFQNGLYDIAFLLRSVGIRVMGAEHDTMLLHHALQPESLKGLGYLGSIYTDHGPWKSERLKSTTIKRDE